MPPGSWNRPISSEASPVDCCNQDSGCSSLRCISQNLASSLRRRLVDDSARGSREIVVYVLNGSKIREY